MTYLDFLKKLLAFGDKLPQVLTIIQAIIVKLDELAALFGVTPEISHNAPVVGAEELSLEGQCAALIPPEHGASVHGKIGDGTLLRNLWSFLQAHPELISLLLTFIK